MSTSWSFPGTGRLLGRPIAVTGRVACLHAYVYMHVHTRACTHVRTHVGPHDPQECRCRLDWEDCSRLFCISQLLRGVNGQYDRQTHRQNTDRWMDRQAGRQTHRQMDRWRDGQDRAWRGLNARLCCRSNDPPLPLHNLVTPILWIRPSQHPR